MIYIIIFAYYMEVYMLKISLNLGNLKEKIDFKILICEA